MSVDTAAAAVWADPDAYATTLLALGIDRYGPTALAWLPATWLAEIAADSGVQLAPPNVDRLMAGVAVLTRPDHFYAYVPSFCEIALGLAADYHDPAVADLPTADDVLWAVVEAYLLDPPEAVGGHAGGDRPRFAPEVNRFVNFVTAFEGFAHLPPPFHAFGVTPDAAAFAGHDYAAEPALALAATAGGEAREEALAGGLADRLDELAAQIEHLPVAGGRGAALAAELRAKLPARQTPGPPSGRSVN